METFRHRPFFAEEGRGGGKKQQKPTQEQSKDSLDDYVGAGRAFSPVLSPYKTGPKGEPEERIINAGIEVFYKGVQSGKKIFESTKAKLSRRNPPQ